ncbi:ATP-binding protein [Kitasatospora aburaviensis]
MIAGCCWCWTTASTWSRPAPPWWTGCCAAARSCGFSPPHASRWARPGRSGFPPLPVPGTTDPGAVAGSDAVRLFFDRAAAVLPGFAPETADTAAVARLCRRLEGIPLAVELAAAWLRSLTVEQIEARLDERYRLLSLGRRTAPARQQTLRALIDWSHDLCTGPERLLWARLSVFYGGIDLAAAEHVCAGDGLDPGEALRLLDSLVDKSIVTREEHRGRVRYRMLETLREYGEELLVAAGDRRRVRRRHRDWYERLAARFAAEWMGPDQAAWVATWDAEYPNLRAALEFCADEPGRPWPGCAWRWGWTSTGRWAATTARRAAGSTGCCRPRPDRVASGWRACGCPGRTPSGRATSDRPCAC